MLTRQCIPACAILLLSISLTAQTIKRYDVIINEIFPDPSPPVQLPASEFIELKNISTTAINLRHFTLTDGSTKATINTGFTLQPDSFVIICATAAVPSYQSFGATIGVTNFPSLNNDADNISLYASNGALLHSISYSSTFYQNAVKASGGWSLEMIDPNNACGGAANWQASTDHSGGTPGKINSIHTSNPDNQPPALLRTYTIDSITIVAVFDEPIDSTTATVTANYQLNQHHPIAASPIMPACTEVLLKLPTPMNSIYQLSVKNISDCSGNTINQFNTAQAGLPQTPGNNTIVINELLFNPPPDGYDYIELYNRSEIIVDLNQLFLNNQTPLTNSPYLFFPGQYKVITINKQWLQQQYLLKDPETILESTAFPSMPDDKGNIILQNRQGAVIDAVHYEEKWHFALLDNKEGIALERINYHSPAQDRANWSSAASTTRFGTPGYPNSQLQPNIQTTGAISISPLIFSPDNDGRDDYSTIQLQLPQPGYVANIFIFDAQGHRVRYLVQQATLAITNQFRWDGLDDSSSQLPAGNYIILAELFNLNGQTKKFKNVITLLRR